MALTETWLSNEEVNNRHVVNSWLYVISRSPKFWCGVLINDRVKRVTRLVTINNAVKFESIEMIITIVSISTRQFVIY